jgi:hypothetical protein
MCDLLEQSWQVGDGSSHVRRREELLALLLTKAEPSEQKECKGEAR